MKPAETYWQYADIAKTPLSCDERSSTEATIATPQEIGWQKKFQFARAVNHARAAKATSEEIIYLAHHGLYYPSTPKRGGN